MLTTFFFLITCKSILGHNELTIPWAFYFQTHSTPVRALAQQTTEKTAPKSKTDSKPKKAKTTTTAAKKVLKSEEKKDVSTSSAPEEGPRTSVWLMKSEPDTFSIDALINSPDSTSHWDGVVGFPLFFSLLHALGDLGLNVAEHVWK